MTTALTEKHVQTLLDLHAIANLQGRYLYYMQAHRYDLVMGLFAQHDPEVSVEISSTGVYVGLTKIEALFLQLIKPLFTAPGSLPIHMLTTPVIDVAADAIHATGMWQTLGCNTFPTQDGLQAVWQQGKYDNTFVKEAGQWRFKRFRWLCNFRTAYDQGWVKQPLFTVEPLDLRHFPESVHPSRASLPYPSYDPENSMDFGPLPAQGDSP
jgi:SnoaL-like domain